MKEEAPQHNSHLKIILQERVRRDILYLGHPHKKRVTPCPSEEMRRGTLYHNNSLKRKDTPFPIHHNRRLQILTQMLTTRVHRISITLRIILLFSLISLPAAIHSLHKPLITATPNLHQLLLIVTINPAPLAQMLQQLTSPRLIMTQMIQTTMNTAGCQVTRIMKLEIQVMEALDLMVKMDLTPHLRVHSVCCEATLYKCMQIMDHPYNRSNSSLSSFL